MSTTLIVVASATPASVLGALAMLLPALRAREVARVERAYADKTFAAAESLADEVERTRNLPWYWPTDPDVTGEIVAEQVHEVLALSDRPAADEDEVGDEQPGSTLMRPVLAVAPWVGYALALVDTVVDFVRTKFADALRTYRERNQVGTGETPWVLYDEDELRGEGMSDEDILALREGLVRIPTVADEDRWAEDAAITDGPDTAEPVNPRPYEGRHWVSDVQHTGAWPVINATVPAQRTGDADV